MLSQLPCWFDAKNTCVATVLLSEGFIYEGLLEPSLELDYQEAITNGWIIGSICADNSLIVICDGAMFSFNCVGESDTENRWQFTKRLIKQAFKTYQPETKYTQLELFAA